MSSAVPAVPVLAVQELFGKKVKVTFPVSVNADGVPVVDEVSCITVPSATASPFVTLVSPFLSWVAVSVVPLFTENGSQPEGLAGLLLSPEKGGAKAELPAAGVAVS